MCMHENQNCSGANCPCDCMNCLFGTGRDDSLLSPPAPDLTAYLLTVVDECRKPNDEDHFSRIEASR